jgi:hypothetical protein
MDMGTKIFPALRYGKIFCMNENNVQHDAATGGNIPPSFAASSGTLPQDAEKINNPLPQHAARTAEHTLTVRDIVRLFEIENIFVAERTITNWCHANKKGISRLDGFFDEEERRWLITPASVQKVLDEEKKKIRKGVNDISAIGEELSAAYGTVPQKENDNAASSGNVQQQSEEHFRTVPQHASPTHHERDEEGTSEKTRDDENNKLRELEEKLKEKEKELFDLKVLNAGKDYFMDQMKETNGKLLDDMKKSSELVGELKTKVLQIEAPKSNNSSDDAEPARRVFNVGEVH